MGGIRTESLPALITNDLRRDYLDLKLNKNDNFGLNAVAINPSFAAGAFRQVVSKNSMGSLVAGEAFTRLKFSV